MVDHMTWEIEILSVGKTKEIWLKAAIDTYEKRLQGVFKISFTLVSSDASLEKAVLKRKHLVFLDPLGKTFSSPDFSDFLFEKLNASKEALCFVIGGAEGIPNHLLIHGSSLSLSKMTLTHQMARLFLVEQIYRANEIEKGSPYHK